MGVHSECEVLIGDIVSARWNVVESTPPLKELKDVFRPWNEGDPGSESESLVFPMNHGRHVAHTDCQYLARTGPWYISPKLDGQEGVLVLSTAYTLLKIVGKALLIGKSIGIKERIHLQVELVGEQLWIVELLSIGGVTPSTWEQGQSVLSSILKVIHRSKLPWLGIKPWELLTPYSFKTALLGDERYRKSDGIVLQNATSPPPKWVGKSAYGHAFYFKNHAPYRVTYDIHVVVTPLGISDWSDVSEEDDANELDSLLMITTPKVDNMPSNAVTGTYEVYCDVDQLKLPPDHRTWKYIKYRGDKVPNAIETIRGLDDAATFKEISVCLGARDVLDLKHEFDIASHTWLLTPVYKWSDESKLRIAGTYPGAIKLSNNGKEEGRPHLTKKLYDDRLKCMSWLLTGMLDDVLFSTVASLESEEEV